MAEQSSSLRQGMEEAGALRDYAERENENLTIGTDFHTLVGEHIQGIMEEQNAK